jgi:hypothetical protein
VPWGAKPRVVLGGPARVRKGNGVSATKMSMPPPCVTSLRRPRAPSPQVDEVLGDRAPAVEDFRALRFTTRVINEAMRLYPQPPVLIRRALQVRGIVGLGVGVEGGGAGSMWGMAGGAVQVGVVAVEASSDWWGGACTRSKAHGGTGHTPVVEGRRCHSRAEG